MNVIFLSKREGKARQLNLAHPLTLSLIGAFVLVVLSSAFMLGVQLGRDGHGGLMSGDALQLGGVLAQQKQQISELKQQLQLRVDAMAMRLGEVNAHVLRLDALGKRLTEMADIDSREFNFDHDPPRGGSGEGEGVSAQIPGPLGDARSRWRSGSIPRESQLAALENVILAKELKREIHPEGRPVESGFISSYFGEREDPFDGQETFHKGVDFAGAKGSTVVAVAAGVVTWAGERSGFGKLVEINHGDGYVTRYGHNEKSAGVRRRDGQARRPGRDSWAPPVTPPARTCTSRCCATAARSIRSPSSAARPPPPAFHLEFRAPENQLGVTGVYCVQYAALRAQRRAKCLGCKLIFPTRVFPCANFSPASSAAVTSALVRGWARYVRAANAARAPDQAADR